MKQMIAYRKSIPVRHTVDVFVAGGGPAGIAAALVAARQGRRVFLAEGGSCFGGMGTAGLVPVFMMFGNGKEFLADGIGREVLDRLNAEKGEGYPGGPMCIPAEILKRVYDRMVVESGMDFSFQTQVVDVKRRGSRITAAICSAKSGFFAVKAKMFIDATGDGDLSVFAGAPWQMGEGAEGPMPGTLCSLWADVDFDAYVASGVNVKQKLAECFEKEDLFTVKDPHHPGMWRVGTHVTGGNMGHAFGVDSTDERSVTKHLVEGRARVLEFQKFYQKYIPGYEKMDLVATGSVLGIRESRRIQGDYLLCRQDFIDRAVFPDEIGRYCYPIDIHRSSTDAKSYAEFDKEYHRTFKYAPGESYGIPYRCLTPQGLSNLLVAGRCVSTDRSMQASLRVMPGCYITGQAAGMAAHLAIRKKCDVHTLDTELLRAQLRKIGACLP